MDQMERIIRLEAQQKTQETTIARLVDLVERVTRMEERQQALSRIVYGAIGVLVTIEVGGVLYVLQQLAGGGR
ncbi:MAG: hypothetical protein OXG44_01420 [Gammaproteobacteria bacterium]|nr:hypothetical protein [Gammaproteobacteria bacterium]